MSGLPSIPVDPELRQQIIQRTAEILAARAEAELGGIDQLILIQLPTAAQMFGVTRTYIGRKFTTHALTDRSLGVRLADLKAALGLNEPTATPAQPS